MDEETKHRRQEMIDATVAVLKTFEEATGTDWLEATLSVYAHTTVDLNVPREHVLEATAKAYDAVTAFRNQQNQGETA